MIVSGLARLGRDAELRVTPGGDAVCSLSLAVNYGRKGQDGNRPTQWIDAALWGKQAEALAPYLMKGSVHCFVLSDLHIETYQKNGGGEGTKLVARVDSVELGPRVEQQGGQQQYQPAQQQRQPLPQQARQAPQQNGYQQARGGASPSQQRPQQQAPQDYQQYDEAPFSDSIPF